MTTKKLLSTMRLMTFMTVFALISMTAHAEMTHTEMAHHENLTVVTGGGHNTSKEATVQLELEQWMVNDDYWRVASSANMMETLPLEEWMSDRTHFQTQEQRKLNAIEDWMVDNRFWNI